MASVKRLRPEAMLSWQGGHGNPQSWRLTPRRLGRIAVTYMEWSGPSYQQALVPWTIVGSRDQAEAFAASLETVPITRESGTSISGGLEAAARLFASSGARGERQVIDVSGDGPNNMGMPVAAMRDSVRRAGNCHQRLAHRAEDWRRLQPVQHRRTSTSITRIA